MGRTKRPAPNVQGRPRYAERARSINVEVTPTEDELVQVVEEAADRLEDAAKHSRGVRVAALDRATGLEQVDLPGQQIGRAHV